MTSIGTPLMWAFFGTFLVLVLVLVLVVDFHALNRRGARSVSIGEAAAWSLVWVVVPFGFVVWMWWQRGGAAPDPALRAAAGAKALEFVTGYLVEKALAVDNIFVFLILFTYFWVAAECQRRVLMIGILGALVLRAVMILVGAWLIANFHWGLYPFVTFLLFTGVKMWWAAGQEPDLASNPALRWMHRRFRISPTYDGERFFTVVGGARMATPLFVVIALVGIVDVVFAVDSIPAIFAITTDSFIVLTSNVFAILGLRAMYFLLAGMHERVHLRYYRAGDRAGVHRREDVGGGFVQDSGRRVAWIHRGGALGHDATAAAHRAAGQERQCVPFQTQAGAP